MQQNQLVSFLSLGSIIIALSLLFRSSAIISTILLLMGCVLVGFVFLKLFANSKKRKE
ncbi:hypothetical protein [Neobacillus sp. PS3-40]|uniref:hypothetical protein n=1 Tax=Neobacillus sp. PS3-40 TaxID=3070679 RepID=UPI0027E0B201|nr:hypothetical protein [Neobacillus sp. PS3-40]WML44324.1 hypothetical protein RCG20_21580 [Neobacillus sp. PS3-40]